MINGVMYRLRHEEVKLTRAHPGYESTNSPQRFLLYVRFNGTTSKLNREFRQFDHGQITITTSNHFRKLKFWPI